MGQDTLAERQSCQRPGEALRRRSYGFSAVSQSQWKRAHPDLVRIKKHGGFLEDPRCLMDLPYLQGDAMFFWLNIMASKVRETLYWCVCRGDRDGMPNGVFGAEG